MRVFKSPLSNVLIRKVFLTWSPAILLMMLVSSATKASNDPVCIDTAMPAVIPQEIVDDWKAQGITDVLQGHKQRIARLQPFAKQLKKLLCSRHYNEGGSRFGYLEDVEPDSFGSIDRAGIPGKSMVRLFRRLRAFRNTHCPL